MNQIYFFLPNFFFKILKYNFLIKIKKKINKGKTKKIRYQLNIYLNIENTHKIMVLIKFNLFS
jgi:hypothetical protein